MGYEIVFHYKNATEQPGVYEDEIKTKNCKVGKVTEDVELNIIAGKIMSQLARRNILIVDVDIYEYAKKKLGYRETADGIVIRNKKFSFDSGCVVVTDEFDSDDDFKPVPSPSKELADNSCRVKRIQSPNLARRAIRHEMYDPDPIGQQKVEQRGLRFTLGKKYPIYSEESAGSTLIYVTVDDSGKDVKVSAEYFVAVGAGLLQADDGPTYVGAENQKEEINLWGRGYESADVPDIRRK